jgi:hypothetical protein
MGKAYNLLMHEVCVGLGWCGGPRHVGDYIPESGSVTADQFVEWLLEAEDADPYDLGKWQKHKDRLREAFVRHMGSEVVDASALKWQFD